MPELLKKIDEYGDFTIDVDWSVHSWVPLVSRLCPSDTYKIYKKVCTLVLPCCVENGTTQRCVFVFFGL